jgi:uncharacterized delta-60 repeat protein
MDFKRATSARLAVLACQCCLGAFLASAQSPTVDSFSPILDGYISVFAIDADGGILVGGSFANADGQPRSRLARLTPAGALDPTFNPAPDGNPSQLLVQGDRRIVVLGSFQNIAGTPRKGLARLNPDGILDAGFDPAPSGNGTALALQPDGKILVAGAFITANGRLRVARLRPDGSIDPTFDPAAGAYGGTVFVLAVQGDGGILVGGGFATMAGQPRNGLGRLLPDGQLDPGFDPSPNGQVTGLDVQADGKILVIGMFTTVRGQPRAGLARINADGTLDNSFNPASTNSQMINLALQVDQRILVGGSFTNLAGRARENIGRLNADGTLDTTFAPGSIDGSVTRLTIQPDGKLLLGGAFHQVGGQSRAFIARLNAIETPTVALTFDGASLTWLRGGTSPEVSRSSFDHSEDGVNWTHLGEGTRIPGGWQMSGAGIPPGGALRAQGWVWSAGGESEWMHESLIGEPVFRCLPGARTNAAGSVATFSVSMAGAGPFAYQWFKGAAALRDGGVVAGAMGPTLTLTGVQMPDEGDYSVAVSNASGTSTSPAARLTIIDLVLTLEPAGLNCEPGQGATFRVGATGTQPIIYQWWKDAAPLPGATNPTLTLGSVQPGDAGFYHVELSNPRGSVTSVLAGLTVNLAAVDSDFAVGGADAAVTALAIRSDGRIQTGEYYPSTGMVLKQLSAMGSRLSWPWGLKSSSGVAESLAVLEDGSMYVGVGSFLSLLDRYAYGLARVGRDDVMDSAFNPITDIRDSVLCLARQPDGKMLVGGTFMSFSAQTRSFLVRLNVDGSLDPAFVPVLNGSVRAVLLQPDQKVLIGGGFTSVGGEARPVLARLHPDGRLDASFGVFTNRYVEALALQPDGRILVAGSVPVPGATRRGEILRLRSDGTEDETFRPILGANVYAIALQVDGKIVLGGSFTNLAGNPRSHLARLHSDGSLDLHFGLGVAGALAGAVTEVRALAIQTDGKLLVGGGFTQIGGASYTGIARVRPSEPATQSLSVSGSSVAWRRGGTSPEMGWTAFEVSTNGIAWTPLGQGRRIPDGWDIGSVTSPTGATIRARGHVSGIGSRSSWFVETVVGPPAFVALPVGRTNNAGTTASFSAIAVGAGTVRYQWLLDGTPLVDGGNISGATTRKLTLNSVFRADAGRYEVVVSNEDGNLTSPAVFLTVVEPIIQLQPDDSYRQAGDSAKLTVTAIGTAPLNYQWWKDGLAVTRGTDATLAFSSAQGTDAGNYSVVVSNLSGSVTSRVATLRVNEVSLDPTFSPSLSGWINSMVIQPDQRIVVAGRFEAAYPGLRRLEPDGRLETNYAAGQFYQSLALSVQFDWKLLVAGSFWTSDPVTRQNLARLELDGSVDRTFDPSPNGTVACVAAQADGRLLMGGSFTALAGFNRAWIGRLNADGTPDRTFVPVLDAAVLCLGIQTDGRILVGGTFTNVSGQNHRGLARLNADGTVDATFTPRTDGVVHTLTVLVDGRIVVGGAFTNVAGQQRLNIACLNPDGTLNSEFNPGVNGTVRTLAVQTDGRIMVGSDGVGRLLPRGAWDPSFASYVSYSGSGNNNFVKAITIQPDGCIVVAGTFSGMLGQSRGSLGRLVPPSPASHTLVRDGSVLTWQRSGSGPEVWRTVFEHSVDGVTWTSLGSGTRVGTGWMCGPANLPPGGVARVRGWVMGGSEGSGWFLEALNGIPTIVAHPASRTNQAGSTATFTVVAAGTGTLAFQWRKNGVVLAGGGNVAGATSATLTINTVLKADEGDYSVVVRNADGSVVSAGAALRVIDPWILTQPVALNREPGQSATLSVAAVGTAPLRYQWLKDGLSLPAGTNATLSLAGLKAEDAGNYRVVVSNAQGEASSAVAEVTVNQATLDPTFNPVLGASASYSFPGVYDLAVEPDGQIVLAGTFIKLDGQAHLGIGRVGAGGAADHSFSSSVGDSSFGMVYGMTLQTDGKLVVGGSFTKLNGVARSYLGRFNSDGTLDTSYAPNVDYDVRSTKVQIDGNLLVAGEFSTVDLARIRPNGTRDTGFRPATNSGGSMLEASVVQSDGKIIVAGGFTTLGSQPRNGLGRLYADGTLDASFNTGGSSPHAMVQQPDGKLLVEHQLTNDLGQAGRGIERLLPDGTRDLSFTPAMMGELQVSSLVLQMDGKLLACGSFTNLAGQPRNHIARLNADGTLDSLFSPASVGSISVLSVQPDGRILVGGTFTNLCGQKRTGLARLNATEPATQSLSLQGSTLTWLRGGSGPEIWFATFESSVDRVTWTSLGTATRIAGGWQLTGVTLAPGSSIRARGYVCASSASGGWFVESIGGLPVITTQPAGRTNAAISTASFNVVAVGPEPLSYQWFKDHQALTDGGNISGARTSTLTLARVLKPDEGRYSVEVSNPEGAVSSLDAQLAVIDPAITTHPANQNLAPGQSATISASMTGTAPLSYEWWKDGVLLSQGSAATQSHSLSLSFPSLEVSHAGDYWVVVRNAWGASTSRVGSLTVNTITPDTAFVGDLYYGHRPVRAMGLQVNGRIVAGGEFDRLGGTNCSGFGRLLPSGRLETAFNLVRYSYSVDALCLLEDGKILAGGYFDELGGASRINLARLNLDGTLDLTFNRNVNGRVSAMALQPDGRILLGGEFTTLGGQIRTRLARLNVDGSLDSSLNLTNDNAVQCLAMQPDGKILVGGWFLNLGGFSRKSLARLNPNGTVDSDFNPGAPDSVMTMAVQPDGKILIGGYFETVAGQPRAHIARLNADGTLDASFSPSTDARVFTLALQSNGKILIGGSFTNVSGQTRYRIARLHPDGRVDNTFNPGAPGTGYVEVSSLALETDGSILVGGSFTNLGGQARETLGRLRNNEPSNQSLEVGESTLTWWRTGSLPEVWRVAFAYSLDGLQWTPLGPGVPIRDGWRISGISVPPSSLVRAHGFVTGGADNSSSWFTEIIKGAPVIATQPVGGTYNAGSTATFTVVANGAGASLFQWFKDGIPLADGGNISGSRTPSLTLRNLRWADAGAYTVSATNNHGGVTSTAAILRVRDPYITVQPAGLIRDLGQDATLTVNAVGTLPLRYEWWKDGETLPQGQTQTLTLTNLSGADRGTYTVVVGGPYDLAIGDFVRLEVNEALLDGWLDPVADATVLSLAVQPDAKIVMGGLFSTAGGQPRNRIARLLPEGTLDPDFNPSADDAVMSCAIQADGRILVVGAFTRLGGAIRNRIGRLLPSGALDLTFHTAADNPVYALIVLPDGRVVVGGNFTTLGGVSRRSIGRLQPDGTVDPAFNPDANGVVFALAQQPDGRLLIGGGFTAIGGQSRTRLARLLPDGTLDPTFTASANGYVKTVAVQPDGKILVGGLFTTLAGQSRSRLARLHPDGTLDAAFAPAMDAEVSTIALQADGSIVIGGEFTVVAGEARSRIARLDAAGVPDPRFLTAADDGVRALTIQPDGKVLAAGTFQSLGGRSRTRVARLRNPDAADPLLTVVGSQLVWRRGPGSPEVSRVVFEESIDGVQWSALGTGSRVSGGWELADATVQPGAKLRVRGWVSGGSEASGWFAESTVGSPSPRLLLRAVQMLPDSRLQLETEGSPGSVAEIQYRPSLTVGTWFPLGTVTNQTGFMTFTIPSNALPRLFLRLKAR